ncbi:chaplin [Streptomyces echinatus]|uniref:chaplin n=1 Tax=Streptomyces echinatus TaxID=67293 RepID=UPI0037914402
MRRTTRTGVIAVAVTGAMAVTLPVSAAFAADGAEADGTAAGSPGVLSGNTIQVPVHVPLNVCGNTVDVVGLLNPAAGNSCENKGAGKGDGAGKSDGSITSGGSSAHGSATDSPGVLSGNLVQLPIHVPANVTGNSVNVVGVGNPVIGNHSVNGSGEHPESPVPKPRSPKPVAHVRSHPAPRVTHAPRPVASSLARTGADLTVPAAAGSVALLVAGGVLYRRSRPARTR